MRSLVTSIFLYACESWTLTAELQRIQAMEMRCYRKILHISYKVHVNNEAVCAEIQRAHRTIRRPPDHRKETRTEVAWTCFAFIRSGQNQLVKHSERQRGKEVGRQHQGMDRPGVRQVPEGSGERGKTEETGCDIICGAPTTLAAGDR